MKVSFVWKYHPVYLRQFEAEHPDVLSMDYEAHRAALLADHYAWPADLCRCMRQHGADAEFVVGNCPSLQKKWAREQHFSAWREDDWEPAIAAEQLRRRRPDWLVFSYAPDVYKRLLPAVLPHVGRVAMWMGVPFNNNLNTDRVSVLLTENPATLRASHDRFDSVLVTPPGFDPEVLTAVGSEEKRYDVTFIGQLTRVHTRRLSVLSYLIDHGIDLRLRLFVTGGHIVSRGEMLREFMASAARGHGRRCWELCLRMIWARPFNRAVLNVRRRALGPLFGLDMYRELAASRLVLNPHSNLAGSHAGNMRMFEATGVGACLVTNRAVNLHEIFEPGREVLAYGSKQELLQVVRAALADPAGTDAVARAGQARTLREHTIEAVFQRIAPVLGAAA